MAQHSLSAVILHVDEFILYDDIYLSWVCWALCMVGRVTTYYVVQYYHLLGFDLDRLKVSPLWLSSSGY